jgi:hypothetical protein
MAASNAPEQNSVTTRDTLISTISTRAVLLGAYAEIPFPIREAFCLKGRG